MANMERLRYVNRRDEANYTYFVRIFSSNQKIRITRLDSELTKLGFIFHKGSSDSADCYEKSHMTTEELHSLKNKLFRYKRYIAVKYCLQKYARSNRYREDFFANSNKMYYRCAYCGKEINRKTMVIDHIFPVQKMMDSAKTRSNARMFGIYETNELRNLAPSCFDCNKRKDTKTGLWVIRGLIGKHENIWRLSKVAGIGLAMIGFYIMIVAFNMEDMQYIMQIFI